MNQVIGIRYIGKKAEMEDTVLNTGAIWKPDQVHNFAELLAVQLLVHTDSFEQAPCSIDGDTYMGSGNNVRKEAPVVAYINLSNMDAPQLALLAKREYGRTVETDGRDIDEIRAEVHRLMVTNNMDSIAGEMSAGAPDGMPYTMMVSVAEHEALMSGLIVAKLVPSEVSDEIPEVIIPPDKTETEEEAAARIQAESNADGDSSNKIPTLDELLNSLDKDGLLAFAIQEKVPGLNARNSVATMRRTISEVLSQKAAEQAATE